MISTWQTSRGKDAPYPMSSGKCKLKQRLCYTRISTANIRTTDDATLVRMWTTGRLLHCRWGCRVAWLLCKTVWQLLTKLNVLLPVMLPGIYPEEWRTDVHAKTCMRMCFGALLTRARTWKQPRCPSTGEWINKPWSMLTVGYHFVLKRKEAMKSRGGVWNAHYCVKKPIWEGCVRYDPKSVTFWKRQSYGDSGR